MKNIKIFSGSSHPALADAVCRHLGMPVSKCDLTKFSNCETNVQIGESVRGQHVYILQSGCGNVNDHIIELCIMISACKIASATKISVVLPCFPYARQPDGPYNGINTEHSRPTLSTSSSIAGAPNSATGYKAWVARSGTLVANLLMAAGADHIISMDLHDPQFQGYFDVPFDMMYAEPSIIKYIVHEIPDYRHSVIVSPDAGGAKRVASISNRLKLEMAMVHKEAKLTSRAGMGLVGDVKGRTCIIVDDIADTCGTLGIAAEILKRHGAAKIYAIVTHGILSNRAVDIINASPIIKLACTNTVPLGEKISRSSKIEQIDVSYTIAEAIRRTHNGESLSHFFRDY
ncbi:phosphoribosyl pyrophosphokinase [Ramicandelaber brevisporus]|nr:phosphoribosyl pyrophosphokinase [Ramicandelaber brevisporus]